VTTHVPNNLHCILESAEHKVFVHYVSVDFPLDSFERCNGKA